MSMRVLGLQQQCLPLDNEFLVLTYNFIGHIYKEKGNDEAAGVFFQKALETEHEPDDDSSRETTVKISEMSTGQDGLAVYYYRR